MTVYAFSTENWKRPQKEVDSIMSILDDYLEEYLRRIDGALTEEEERLSKVHFRFVGDLSVFPATLREKMARVDEMSAHYPFVLNIAVNYGGREEITQACNALLAEVKTRVTEADLCRAMYTSPCRDPDLVVRTGGDLRISNFLLWQSAYAEYYFTDTLWPDLTPELVDEAIANIDKYIDDAYLSGLKQIVIIHGKGTGALRAGVQNYLKMNSHVKSHRPGTFGEGEAGVTVVELK
jgi:undecaprenyl diphosphate synthase